MKFHCTKMKFSIKVFFSKCDQIRSSLRIWSHLLKKSSMENFIFCAVFGQLIECDIGNVFFEKPYTKYGGETIPRPFSINWNQAYLYINSLKSYTVSSYCIPIWWLSKYI